jgi:negative regulator of flagellin synthesis FlgM
MEINGNSSTVNLISQINKAAESNHQEPAKTSGKSKPSGNSDKVELSEQAKEVSRAFAQLKALPDVRQGKVGEIKNQVETGTYRVDGSKIAMSMLNESLENNAILNTIDLEV